MPARLSAAPCRRAKGCAVDDPVGFGQCQRREAVVVHARAHDAGARILAGDHAADRFSNVIAVGTEIRVFATGEKHHEAHAGGARSILAAAARPIAVFRLRRRHVLEAAVVHFTHVPRHDLAEVR